MISIKAKHHWDKILLIMPIFAAIIFGYSLSGIAGNVLFVKRIGSDLLPYTYVVNALVGTVVALAVAAMIGKHSVARMIQGGALIGLLGFSAIYWAIQQDMAWGYAVFLVFAQILYMVLGAIIMWDLGLKICTPLEAKKTFSFFSLGASLGGIAAGMVSSFMSDRYPTEMMLPVVMGSLIFLIVNATVVQWYFREGLKPDKASLELSHWNTVKEGFNFYRNSAIARLLSLILILFFSVRWIGDYEFQKILGSSLTEADYSLISGYVSIAENVGIILMFLFFQRIIMGKLGVLNTLLASPTAILIPFVILFFFPVYLVVTSVKVFTRVINYSSFSSSIRLMYTAIPHAIRSSVTTFIGGNSESGGMLLAGAGLIVLTRYLENHWIIAIGIVLILLMIACILYIKKKYVQQVIHNLEGSDPEDCHNAIENLAEPAYRVVGVNELMKFLQRDHLEIATIRKIVRSLGKIDNVKVIPALLEIFKQYDITVKYAVIEAIHNFSDLNERLDPYPFTRLNLIEAYQRIFLEEEDPDLKVFILQNLRDFDPDHVITFLKDAIESGNPTVRYQAIKAMKYFHDRGIAHYVKPFLNSDDPMVLASSLIALWQFTEMRPHLMKRFIELMNKKDKASILATFLMIAKVNINWEAEFAAGYLKHEDPELRTMAALALLEIEDERGFQNVIDNLVETTPLSVQVARNLKELSSAMRHRLFELIEQRSDEAIAACVRNLQSTYLNFSDDIEQLTQERASLNTFTGRVTLGRR